MFCKYDNHRPDRGRLLAMMTGALVMLSGSATALELGPNLQMHGFLSQGWVWTSDNDFFGDSQDGSFDYTELGVNASWHIPDNLLFSGQILSRRAGQGDDGDLQIDYAFVDYGLPFDELGRAGVRVGRVKNAFGFYNQTRDVIFTRPGILLPQSVYFDRTRDLSLSSDGLYLYAEKFTESGGFYLDIGAGQVQVGEQELETATFATEVPGEFDSDVSYVARLLYESPGAAFRAALSYARVELDYQPASQFDLLPGTLQFEPWIASLQYNTEYWSLTGEYGRRKIRLADFGSPIDTDFTSEYYYLQANYRITPEWDVMVRYDNLIADVNDPDGSRFAETNPFGLPSYGQFARDWTLGLNWSPMSDLTVRTEFHHIDGTGWIPTLDNTDPTRLERRWNMVLMMIGYRF